MKNAAYYISNACALLTTCLGLYFIQALGTRRDPTVITLGAGAALSKTLRSTNPIENLQ